MVKSVAKTQHFIDHNSKELDKSALIKEENLFQPPIAQDLLKQLLIDCEHAFLDLQFKSQASILE